MRITEKIWRRLRATAVSRRARLRNAINSTLAGWGPNAFIWAHWPWPLRKPWQRSRLRVRGPGGGVGDEMMALPILTEIKRRNPRCHITFLTFRPDFFRGHPAIDAFEQRTWADPDPPSIKLAYDHHVPPPRPLMQLMGECVGFSKSFDQLERPPAPLGTGILERVKSLPRPWIVIQPRSSGWTANKDWPADSWDELVKGITKMGSVIEVGTDSPLSASAYGRNFISLVGGTTLEELACVISAADLFVGPVSGGMHLANAFHVPAVIIIGGYEEPRGHPYKEVAFFYSPVECAPCWAKTCPFDLKCLRAISADAVLSKIKSRIESPKSVV